MIRKGKPLLGKPLLGKPLVDKSKVDNTEEFSENEFEAFLRSKLQEMLEKELEDFIRF